MNQELKNLLYDLKELAQNQIPINLISLRKTIENCNYYTLFDTETKNKRLDIINSDCQLMATLTVYILNEHDILISCCKWVKDVPELNFFADRN